MRPIKLLLLFSSISLLASFAPLTSNQSVETIFTEIYDKGIWGRNEQGIGFSGGGSEVKNAKPYMQFLQDFLRTNNIKTVVDVGCGDWTFSQHIQWGDIQYSGFDVVKHVIEKNRLDFSSPTINFIHADAAHADLPEAELMLCKDVLQHLSNEEIFLLLAQVNKFKYCLITNDVNPRTQSSDNHPISNGESRKLDLTKNPFNVEGVKIFTYYSAGDIKQVLLINNTSNLE